MAGRIFPFRRSNKPPAKQTITRASELAVEGRKLAMYDRETGLFAPWFIEMRCTEECYRAVRYRRPLSLVLLQPDASANSDQVVREVASFLVKEGRRSDIAAYLGLGQIAILMPETDLGSAYAAISRLSELVGGVDAGVSIYPTDGGNFEQLKAAAVSQLAGMRNAA